MGRGRGKKKVKPNTDLSSLKAANISLPENINAKEMQHVIAHAILEAEEIKNQKEKKQHEAALAEWRKIIGYKEHKNGIKRFFNDIKISFKILFLPKRYIIGNRASEILLKSLIQLPFWTLRGIAILLEVFGIGYFPIQYLMGNTRQFPWLLYIDYILLAVIAFLFSRLFRMASIEIDKLDDHNYLFGLFASITSFISIVIAVVAIAWRA